MLLFGGNPFAAQQQQEQQNILAAIAQQQAMSTWDNMGFLGRQPERPLFRNDDGSITYKISFIDKLREEIDEWLKL